MQIPAAHSFVKCILQCHRLLTKKSTYINSSSILITFFLFCVTNKGYI